MSTDLSKKLFALRKKHGLTLEQVANVVGVGKSTVRKWETGMIANMRRDKVALLAKALHTTPAYLMGWTEEEIPSAAEPKLSEGEEMLLDLFRRIPEEQQKMVLDMIRVALNTLQ